MVTRVLVGVDFSEASRTALQRAREWAERMGVPLLAMHVMHDNAFALGMGNLQQ